MKLPDTAGQDRSIEPRHGWWRHRVLLVAIVTLALVVAVFWKTLAHYAGANASVSMSRLTIATVKRGEFVRDVGAEGQVVAAVSPTLYASATGTVTLKVHAGDTVTKGMSVAVIDSPDLAAKLAQEEALMQSQRIDWQRAQRDAERALVKLQDALDQAAVDLKTAQRESERSHKAYELGAISELQALRTQDALEKAQFAYDQAKMNFESQPEQNRFDVDSKKALLDRQQYALTELRRQVAALNVRSPVDGQVGQVQVANRASVAQDAALLTVVDLSALEVEIKVPESFARDLKPGMSAELDSDNRQWSASVSGVSPEVVSGQVTARLRFGDDKPAGLRQSQRLSVRIFLDRHDNALLVDRGPFLDQDGGHFVYRVRDNIAERMPVKLGQSSVQQVEVLEGLKVGDRIVVAGSDVFDRAERVILTH